MHMRNVLRILWAEVVHSGPRDHVATRLFLRPAPVYNAVILQVGQPRPDSSYVFAVRGIQQRTILSASMPRVALRVSTTSFALATILA